MSLKELPEGTVWPHLFEKWKHEIRYELKSYADCRIDEVKRGAETPEFAALLVEKFAAGMLKTALVVGIDNDFQKLADELVAEIDPDYLENKKARWNSRPAFIGKTTDD